MAVDTKTILQETYNRLGFTPTESQWPPLLCEERIILVAGGERAGKSLTGEKYLMGRWDLGSLYWIVGIDYETCRPEFEYALYDAQELGLLLPDYHLREKDQCSFEMGAKGKPITRIVTKSLKDPVKIGKEAPDGIVVCEIAQIPYSTYLKLLARTAERRGWLLGTGTFEGSLGWYPELIEYYQTGVGDGKSFSIPSWSNKAIFPGGRDDSEIKRWEALFPADLFMERFGGVPCKPSGLVIKEFANRIHVGEYEFNRDLPVEIAVDPGYLGAHAVLGIQQWGEQIVIVDEVYLQGYVTEEIIDICKLKPWWANVSGGVIDIAGRQHQAMKAPVEVWREKANISLQSKVVNEDQGIDLLRTFLKPHPVSGKPHLLVDYKAKGFISECGGGKSPVLEGGPWLRDVNMGKPISKNDHACKAMIYWLANKFGYVTERKSQKIHVKTMI